MPRKRKFVAAFDNNGTVIIASRSSTHNYRFASVVRWPEGNITVGVKWAATEAAARSCLTEEQLAGGAEVIAVARTTVQPDLSAAEHMFGSLLPHPGKGGRA